MKIKVYTSQVLWSLFFSLSLFTDTSTPYIIHGTYSTLRPVPVLTYTSVHSICTQHVDVTHDKMLNIYNERSMKSRCVTSRCTPKVHSPNPSFAKVWIIPYPYMQTPPGSQANPATPRLAILVSGPHAIWLALVVAWHVPHFKTTLEIPGGAKVHTIYRTSDASGCHCCQGFICTGLTGVDIVNQPEQTASLPAPLLLQHSACHRCARRYR